MKNVEALKAQNIKCKVSFTIANVVSVTWLIHFKKTIQFVAKWYDLLLVVKCYGSEYISSFNIHHLVRLYDIFILRLIKRTIGQGTKPPKVFYYEIFHIIMNFIILCSRWKGICIIRFSVACNGFYILTRCVMYKFVWL